MPSINTGRNFRRWSGSQEQIKDLDQIITREKTNIANQIEAEYRGSRQRELLLQQALDQQKTEASAMADKMVQYNILKRDAEANKQLYDGLLAEAEGSRASPRACVSSNIRVVDPAMVPAARRRRRSRATFRWRSWSGWSAASAWRCLREYMDNTVKNPDDVENLARLPSLAVVPAFAGLERTTVAAVCRSC